MLAVTLFGTTQATRDGASLTITRRKSRAALYAIAAQTKPVARRQLMLLLWPDHTADTARHNLRSTVYSLRQALSDALVVEEDTLALAEGTVVDVRTFASSLAQPDLDDANLTATLALYQGEFSRVSISPTPRNSTSG
jgi:DNA-binding SARP family transcriptional activator